MLCVGVFYLVFDQLLGTRPPDFLVFLAVGKLTFIWFSKVTQASNSLIQSKGVIAQVNLPKYLFPLSVIQEGLYRQAAVFVFLWVFFFCGLPATDRLGLVVATHTAAICINYWLRAVGCAVGMLAPGFSDVDSARHGFLIIHVRRFLGCTVHTKHRSRQMAFHL